MNVAMNRINRLARRPRPSRAKGVTLLELMIVLAIVDILAATGYPAYVDYAKRARRADGKAFLMDVQARQERFYFDNNSYTTDPDGGLGYGTTTPTSPDGNYVLKNPIDEGSTGSIATSYVLTAQPNASGSPPFTDAECGNLTIDNRGTQGETGTEDLGYCWGN